MNGDGKIDYEEFVHVVTQIWYFTTILIFSDFLFLMTNLIHFALSKSQNIYFSTKNYQIYFFPFALSKKKFFIVQIVFQNFNDLSFIFSLRSCHIPIRIIGKLTKIYNKIKIDGFKQPFGNSVFLDGYW